MADTSLPASTNVPSKSSLGRSILCIFVGLVAVVALSLGTDVLLHSVAGFPKLGQVFSDRQFAYATIYRTLYGIVGSYITARLAPNRPMMHSLLGGAVGVALGLLGLAAALAQGPKMGPLWYPVALLLTTMPTAWLGAKLRLLQA